MFLLGVFPLCSEYIVLVCTLPGLIIPEMFPRNLQLATFEDKREHVFILIQ